MCPIYIAETSKLKVKCNIHQVFVSNVQEIDNLARFRWFIMRGQYLYIMLKVPQSNVWGQWFGIKGSCKVSAFFAKTCSMPWVSAKKILLAASKGLVCCNDSVQQTHECQTSIFCNNLRSCTKKNI